MNTDEHRAEVDARETGVTRLMKPSLLKELCCNHANSCSATSAEMGSPLGKLFHHEEHEEHEVLKRSDQWIFLRALRALRGENGFSAVHAESICGLLFLLTSNRKIQTEYENTHTSFFS
jgi:hypothetical protein